VEATANAAWVKTAAGILTVPVNAKVGDSVTLSIRPEQLHLGRAGDGATPLGSGRVRETSFQGTHLRARVALSAGDTELLLRAPAIASLVVGDSVDLSVRPADIVILLH
jgi:ABC-type Fe3+/spermidine/putrescine transport system ATPase subunit